MDTVTRAKNVCLTPATEWPVIAMETTHTGTLITEYVLPLAAIGAVAGLVGGSLVGYTLPFAGRYRVPLTTGLATAVFTLVMAVVGVFLVSLIINALAPTFGAEKNSAQALKVAVYSYTPAWVAGVLLVLPMMSTVVVLIAGLYGLYVLYLGLPPLMKCPPDKAVGYTAVVVVCAIVVSIVIGAVSGLIGAGAMMGASVMGTSPSAAARTSQIEFDKNSPMGKLEQLGNKLEESNQKMRAAEKSGDQGAQVSAAMEGLGALLGGGRRVDPIGIDQLKPFVPDTFAGLPKKSSNAEKTGIASIVVSRAEATYGDGADKSVTLEISDSGGASGLMGLAGWANIQGEREDDSSSERTVKVNGRLMHEKQSKRSGGTNEFALVLGDRFVVSASGRGVDLGTLKSAVSSLNLQQLESMKDVGVQK
jgi:hypothetical protein